MTYHNSSTKKKPFSLKTLALAKVSPRKLEASGRKVGMKKAKYSKKYS